MSLQTKLLDFTQASFSNGALLDADGKIKSEAIKTLGTPAITPSSTPADGEFNNAYGRYGLIDKSNRVWVISTEGDKINYYDLNGTYLGKLTFSDRPKNIKADYVNNELVVCGDTNLDGSNNTVMVFDYDTLTLKRAIIQSTNPPDKTKGQVLYVQDIAIDDNGYYYLWDYSTGCIQKYDNQGNWIELFYDSGLSDKHAHIEYKNGYIYCFPLVTTTRVRISVVDGTVETILGTTDNFISVNKGFGKESNIYGVSDFFFIDDRLFIIFGVYLMCEEWDLSLNFVKERNNLFRFGDDISNGEYCLSANDLGGATIHGYGVRVTNNENGYIAWQHQTYSSIFNIGYDQTALWQNQSLGGAGVINQINIKDNNKGTRNWYIKKSSDTTWTSFDPNTYYDDGILNCASFDLKVEMGNFYELDKSQIEIEEVSVLYDDGKPARQIIPLF
jgi:hypothetical protein